VSDIMSEERRDGFAALWPVLKLASLVLAGIALAVLVMEAGLRAMPGLLPRETRLALDLFQLRIALHRTQQEDPELWHKLRPNTDVLIEGHPDYHYRFKTYLNLPDRGFRGNVGTRPLVGVALGDSFTFGAGVEAEEAWPEQLSQLAGRNFANLGVPGYGPPQYTEVLKRYGLSLRPKIVLYAVFQNDLRDSALFALWQDRQVPYPRKIGQTLPSGMRRFLAYHSRLYQLVDVPRSRARLYLEADQERLIFYRRKRGREQPWSGWEVAQRAILSARQMTEKEGAAFVLLLLPSEEQAYWHLVSAELERPDKHDLDAVNRLVGSLCEKERLRCLDLTAPYMERARGGERLYFRIDGHWNAEGHRLAAMTIYDYLRSNRILANTATAR
jgi:hypothetical protein